MKLMHVFMFLLAIASLALMLRGLWVLRQRLQNLQAQAVRQEILMSEAEAWRQEAAGRSSLP